MHEHKKQLHDRILKRQGQLQAELENIESLKKPTRSGHEIALSDALATLGSHLATSWNHVGEVEAGELSRWLERTNILVDESQPADRAEAIALRLESAWKLELYGVPTQE